MIFKKGLRPNLLNADTRYNIVALTPFIHKEHKSRLSSNNFCISNKLQTEVNKFCVSAQSIIHSVQSKSRSLLYRGDMEVEPFSVQRVDFLACTINIEVNTFTAVDQATGWFDFSFVVSSEATRPDLKCARWCLASVH